jgi:DNA-binding SARP family transcriptional activator
MVRTFMSSVALLFLLVAVPIGLLYAGGTPIPRGSWHHLRQTVSSRQGADLHVISGWLIHGAVFLGWVTWSWLVVCAAVELHARLTGRTPSRVPGSKTLQAVVAFLVGTSLATISMGRTLSPPISVLHERTASHVVASNVPGSLRIIGGNEINFGRTSDSPGRMSCSPDGVTDCPTDDPSRSSPVADARRVRVQASMTSDDCTDHGLVGAQFEQPVAADSHMTTPAIKTTLMAPVADLRSVTPKLSDLNNPRVGPKEMSSLTGNSGGASLAIHTVEPRETLWSIAEHRLGSALRWREIAALNYGIRQLDGRALSETHWIIPGWNLVLPHVGERGTTAASYPFDVASRSGLSLGVDRHLVNVPGRNASVDRLPTDRPTVDGAVSSSWLDVQSHQMESQAVSTKVPNNQRGLGGVPLSPVGAGIVGAGVVGVIERMRRVQQRRRREGEMIRLPGAERAELERRLRLGKGWDSLENLDAALRYFSRLVVDRAGPVPAVRGVQIHHDGIEIVVDDLSALDSLPPSIDVRQELPSLFVPISCFESDRASGPMAWRVSRAPYPAMATLGAGPDGPLLANLEEIGSLGLCGDLSACEGIVRSLAVEMATSRWAECFDLCLIGFGEELARFGRIEIVEDASDLVRRLHQRRFLGEASLRESGFRSFAHARMFDSSATWDPVVILCGPTFGGTELAELITTIADPHTGNAVVAIGEGIGARHALLAPHVGRSSSLAPLGSVLFPQGITMDEFDGISALFACAADVGSVSPAAHPYRQLTIPIAADGLRDVNGNGRDPDVSLGPANVPAVGTRSTAGAAFDDHQIEVSILGTVVICGAARPFTRAWAKELVVYLAMHPNGAANDSWATALWPDRLMASSSLHSTASVARRSLGQSAEGADHLPRAHGRLALASTVGTDWDRFVRLSAGEDVVDWKAALELVRGRLFDGLRASDWPILEGIAPAIEATIVDHAGRLAGACLRHGDARGAEWAARKGLLVSPYDERLYRMLLRAADQAGNPAGVESVMSELIHLVADEIEPFDSVHPSTMELYRSLTRRRVLAMTHR